MATHRGLDDFGLTGTDRPLGGILPVVVHAKVLVGIKRTPILGLEYEFPVGRTARPVHHTVGLVGGVVEMVYADLLCDHAHEGGVLVLAYFTGEREHDAAAGILRSMAVC
ncbi:hypothetical protein SDC9_75294 [bioreactor metagenome]|uniref:Uncharacterized protein n=1 Tax=bioreactor metagenome TaxID=1076179 RepID=A0A644YJV4_9ZZZZ